jgi:hypothetical protein
LTKSCGFAVPQKPWQLTNPTPAAPCSTGKSKNEGNKAARIVVVFLSQNLSEVQLVIFWSVDSIRNDSMMINV